MDISDAFNYLNFWINKFTGSWYTIPELENLVDGAQMAYYSDNKAKYATSQEVKEILSPFRASYDFNTTTTASGVIVVPSDSNYLDVLDIQVTYQISNHTFYVGVPLVNEDVRAAKLNSQVDPVTITSPIGEQLAPRYFRIYPTNVGYAGTVTYLRRPVKPVYGHNTISGRVIVYDPTTSTQLEWKQTDIIPILLKALESVGINLSSAEVSQFAQVKTTNNFLGQNRL